MILFKGAIAQVNALEWVIGLSVYADIRVDDRLWLAGDDDRNRQ